VTGEQDGVEPRACFEGASVDPTEARKATIRRFGRSDRRALAGFSQKANHRERQDTGYGYQKD
jgi:hypothetical protein